MTKRDQISTAKKTLMIFLLGMFYPSENHQKKNSQNNQTNLILKGILNNGLNSTSWSTENMKMKMALATVSQRQI